MWRKGSGSPMLDQPGPAGQGQPSESPRNRSHSREASGPSEEARNELRRRLQLERLQLRPRVAEGPASAPCTPPRRVSRRLRGKSPDPRQLRIRSLSPQQQIHPQVSGGHADPQTPPRRLTRRLRGKSPDPRRLRSRSRTPPALAVTTHVGRTGPAKEKELVTPRRPSHRRAIPDLQAKLSEDLTPPRPRRLREPNRVAGGIRTPEVRPRSTPERDPPRLRRLRGKSPDPRRLTAQQGANLGVSRRPMYPGVLRRILCVPPSSNPGPVPVARTLSLRLEDHAWRVGTDDLDEASKALLELRRSLAAKKVSS